MTELSADKVYEAVRRKYGGIAESSAEGCCSAARGCCDDTGLAGPAEISVAIGYTKEELFAAPQGSNMGLGCGNPLAIASLKVGETVLDLGSGGGFDCFLAAQAVGETGRVIGVDATPQMVTKGRRLAAEHGFENVEFRLGEIENLPVADGSVDVIISNCVINLSPRKRRVFEEALRVLKPAGRLAVSDVVATAVLPDEMRADLKLHTGCIAGASLVDDVERLLREVGFANVRIEPKDDSRDFIREWAPGMRVEDFVVSATIQAGKPTR